jgi:hypothetical protein
MGTQAFRPLQGVNSSPPAQTVQQLGTCECTCPQEETDRMERSWQVQRFQSTLRDRRSEMSGDCGGSRNACNYVPAGLPSERQQVLRTWLVALLACVGLTAVVAAVHLFRVLRLWRREVALGLGTHT